MTKSTVDCAWRPCAPQIHLLQMPPIRSGAADLNTLLSECIECHTILSLCCVLDLNYTQTLGHMALHLCFSQSPTENTQSGGNLSVMSTHNYFSLSFPPKPYI